MPMIVLYLPVAFVSLILEACLMMNYVKYLNDCALTTLPQRGKSCFTVFTNKQIEAFPVLKIISNNLSFPSETKIIGLTIDNMLHLAKRISGLCSKVNRNIGVLKK